MRELITARDESHRLSIELALDAAGIPYATTSQSMMSSGYYLPVRFRVNDADYDQARQVVDALDVGDTSG
jgi:hypothetical protein